MQSVRDHLTDGRRVAVIHTNEQYGVSMRKELNTRSSQSQHLLAKITFSNRQNDENLKVSVWCLPNRVTVSVIFVRYDWSWTCRGCSSWNTGSKSVSSTRSELYVIMHPRQFKAIIKRYRSNTPWCRKRQQHVCHLRNDRARAWRWPECPKLETGPTLAIRINSIRTLTIPATT